MNIAKMIDHSLLRPELTTDDVLRGCEIAARRDTAAVCVRPSDVPIAVTVLAGTGVLVGSVAGFPHGDTMIATKTAEVRALVEAGADEIDMVLHIGRLRDGDSSYVHDDIAAVVAAAQGRVVKVILEHTHLTDEQKVTGCKISEQAGAHFVKTSTGFAPGGATLADIRLMQAAVSQSTKIKAAGGVRTPCSPCSRRAPRASAPPPPRPSSMTSPPAIKRGPPRDPERTRSAHRPRPAEFHPPRRAGCTA